MSASESQKKRVFLGVSFCTLDPQRRVVMPRNWRLDGDSVATTFYIMPAPGNIVRVCSEEFFYEQMALLNELNPSDPDNQEGMLLMGSLTQAVVPDRQGRFSLSPEIIEYGHLGNKVALAGRITHGQILSEEDWKASSQNFNSLRKLEQNIYDERQKLRPGRT